MKFYYLTVPAFVLLSACGGGGGGGSNAVQQTPEEVVQGQDGSDTATQDEIDNAVIEEEQNQTSGEDTTPVVAEDVEQVFTNENLIVTDRTVATQSARVPVAGTEDFTLTFNTDGSITLAFDGQTVELGDADGDGNFNGTINQGTDDELFGFLRFRHTAGDVQTAVVNINDATTRREGNVVIGVPTSAAVANGLTGTATYEGIMNARITGRNQTPVNDEDLPPIFDGRGGGTVTADFDANTISGQFDLTEPGAGKFTEATADQFPRTLVELNETSISDGAFDGTVSVTFRDGGGLGNPALAFESGTYEGDLYGDTGGSVGGQFIGTVENGADTYVMQGAFAAD